MKRAPNMYCISIAAKPTDAFRLFSNVSPHLPVTLIAGIWVIARPHGMYTLINRCRLAWMVFTGRADALKWPGQ